MLPMFLNILKLIPLSLIPVIASILVWKLDKKEEKFRNTVKGKILIGVLFGLISVIGSELGVYLNGAVINVRDAAPICAGLIFGAPSGIIAGLIGGAERFAAVAWGAGEYTRVACVASTILAGLFSAALRRFIFDDKMPRWMYGLGVALYVENFHMLMIFLTHLSDAYRALPLVRQCALPMILANSLSVALAIWCVSRLDRPEQETSGKRLPTILETFQRGTLAVMALALAASLLFVRFLETKSAEHETSAKLSLYLEDISEDISERPDQDVAHIAELHNIDGGGYVLIADRSGNIVSHSGEVRGGSLQSIGLAEKIGGTEPGVRFLTETENGNVFGMYRNVGNYTVVAALPQESAMFSRDLIMYITLFLEVIIFGSVFILMYFLTKSTIADNLAGINRSLSRISSGDLNVKVDVRTNSEFSALSDDINKTVETMKGYLIEEAERLDRELELATTIQHSALPNVFPPYPYRHEFDIFAEMVPAKEIGGDFYDFYIVNGNTFVFVVADVSGKGIPASLFMMRSKTMIKGLALSGLSVEEVLRQTNDSLCTENDAEMFVTAWIGGLDLTNGAVSFSNAGHNPPLVRHDGQFEYLQGKIGFVLGGMEDMNYQKQQFKMKKGDAIFLYTDGVTEATNTENQLYGDERLKDFLNSLPEDCSSEEICKRVKADVYQFTGEAPQFDDITVMCVRFLGRMPKVTMEPAGAH